MAYKNIVLICAIGTVTIVGVGLGIALPHRGSTIQPDSRIDGSTTAPSVPVADPCFEPDFVRFSSPDDGWAVGRSSDDSGHGGCPNNLPIAMKRTSDGGRSWTDLPTPPPGFFDYGLTLVDAHTAVTHSNDTLWVTHDSGTNWEMKQIPGVGRNSSLAVSGGRIQVADLGADGVNVYSSPLEQQDSWTRMHVDLPLDGLDRDRDGTLEGYPDIELSGSYGWLSVVGKRDVVASARLVDGAWQPAHQPCGAAGTLESDYYSPDRLLVECGGPGPYGSGKQLPRTMASADGGATFTESAVEWPQVPDFYPSFSAAPGTLAVTSEGRLLVTEDGGSHWTSTALAPSAADIEIFGFASPSEGFAMVYPYPQSPPHARGFVVTRDGGRSWSPVVFS